MLRSCKTKVAKEERFVAKKSINIWNKKANKYLKCYLKQSI